MDDAMIVDLADAAFWQDPYPTWQAAREQHRTARTTMGEAIVMAAADVDLLQTDAAFEQLGVAALERLGISDGPIHEWRRLTMAACDGAQHERLRGLVVRAFTPRRVERVREALVDHLDHLVSDLAGRTTLDVVTDFAHDIPLWLICEFMGLPPEIRESLDQHLAGTEEAFADPMTPERRAYAERSITALYTVVEDVVDRRSTSPTEDLVSDLLESERAGRVERPETLALLVNVIGGAVGSSRSGIANAVHLLLRHPDQRRLLDDDQTLAKAAIEECLRFRPPFRSGRRRALRDTEAFGLRLRAGETVFVARQAANRDPARWDDPDRFDITRPEIRHFSFGYGAHFCIGQALARLDIQESVLAFLRGLPTATLVEPEPERVPFTADEQFVSLPVRVAG